MMNDEKTNKLIADIREALEGHIPEETIAKIESQARRIGEIDSLATVLRQDYQLLLNESVANPNDQLGRRTLIRTEFAVIEGAVSSHKQMVIDYCKRNGLELSQAEYALLHEESYELDDNGKPRIAEKFLKLPANLKFAFSMYASKIGGIEFALDPSGWQNFLAAIKIRNRLIHPKSVSDLEVTDADMHCVMQAATWYFKEDTRLVSQAIKPR
jgi:hypothetical protein